MHNISAQGRTTMTDEIVEAAKAATTSAAMMAGIATWIGVVLPPVILVLTAFTLICASSIYVYKFYRWYRYPWLRGK